MILKYNNNNYYSGDKMLEEGLPKDNFEEEEEDEDEKEFPPLTKEKKVEIKKFESQLSKCFPQ